jgi:hypothetical protein
MRIETSSRCTSAAVLVTALLTAMALAGCGGGADDGGIRAETTPTPAPTPADPTTPTPTTDGEDSQSVDTWVDTRVAPGADGRDMQVPDPLQKDRQVWFRVVVDHLEDGQSLLRESVGPWGVTFELQAPASTLRYQTFGRIGLYPAGDGLDPTVGCRHLTEGLDIPPGADCRAERLSGPEGEPAVIARSAGRCGVVEYGVLCGEYRVWVGVERQDGLVGYVQVDGRGTPDSSPFSPTAMAAAASDRRLALPDVAFAVPSSDAVRDVVEDRLPNLRVNAESGITGHIGYGTLHGKLGRRLYFMVTVTPAGDAPRCGRDWLIECVERRVSGADDPTTVLVGAWDEQDWASCCPKDSRADAREIAYVGPRHTVVVSEIVIVRKDEPPISADLDQALIDLVLDPRLQEAAGGEEVR